MLYHCVDYGWYDLLYLCADDFSSYPQKILKKKVQYVRGTLCYS